MSTSKLQFFLLVVAGVFGVSRQGVDYESVLRLDLEHKGATFGAWQISSSDAGRGVFASAAMPTGTVVLRLPRECCIVGEEAFLAQWILENENSNYVLTLPLRFSAVLSKDLPEPLCGEWTARLARLAAEAAARGFSADRWRWASQCVLSRAFMLPLNDPPFGACLGEFGGEDSPQIPALVPLADMLNHACDGNCEWGVERATGDFVIRTRRPCALGEELRHSYGELSAAEALLNYGFFDLQAARRFEVIVYPITDTQLWRRDSSDLLSNDGRAASSSSAVLSLARVTVATAEEIESLDDGSQPASGVATEPLSFANERRAVDHLHQTITAALAASPKKTSGLVRQYLAVRKEGLHRWLHCLQNLRELLLEVDDPKVAFNTGLYYRAFLEDILRELTPDNNDDEPG